MSKYFLYHVGLAVT